MFLLQLFRKNISALCALKTLSYAMEQVFAIGIGVVPVLKNLIFTDDAPLFFFTDSCLILG
jgi:hypothetical protein